MLLSENTKVTISLFILISIVVSMISLAFIFGTKLENYEGRLSHVEDKTLEHDAKAAEHDAINNRLNTQDIALAEIRTDLKWIRANMEGKIK